MKPVYNLCRWLSHKPLQNIYLSHKPCFGLNIGQRRCISGFNQCSDRSVTFRERNGAPLSGHWLNVTEKTCVIPSIFYIPKRMAGHSHYANVKDVKEKFDKQKSVIRSQYLPKLIKAIRDGGSAKPSQNPALDKLIKEGKKQNIPMQSIEKTIKREEVRLQGGSAEVEEFYAEIVAAGGIGIIVVGDHNIKVKSHSNSVIKKFPELKKGSAMRYFEKKGNILVVLDKEEKTIDLDKYLEIGIEVGAEDVVIEKDSEEEKILKFICEAKMVNQMDKGLTSKGLDVILAESVYEATTTVGVDQEQMEYLEKIVNKLQESEDITNVYINCVLE